MATGGDFFQPPLPFDPEILRNFQSLTDPNEWNDVSFPCECLQILADVISFGFYQPNFLEETGCQHFNKIWK